MSKCGISWGNGFLVEGDKKSIEEVTRLIYFEAARQSRFSARNIERLTHGRPASLREDYLGESGEGISVTTSSE
jgi:hypothetical protein